MAIIKKMNIHYNFEMDEDKEYLIEDESKCGYIESFDTIKECIDWIESHNGYVGYVNTLTKEGVLITRR